MRRTCTETPQETRAQDSTWDPGAVRQQMPPTASPCHLWQLMFNPNFIIVVGLLSETTTVHLEMAATWFSIWSIWSIWSFPNCYSPGYIQTNFFNSVKLLFFLSSAAHTWQVSKNKHARPQQMASRSVHWCKWRMLCMPSWRHLTLANVAKNSDRYVITRSQSCSYLQWHMLIGEDKQQGMKDSWNRRVRTWEKVSISKWLHWVCVVLHFGEVSKCVSPQIWLQCHTRA